MVGALLCGLVYRYTQKLPLTYLGEVIGTGILGALAAYPVAIWLMGMSAGEIAFYAYIFPFFISTACGALISWVALAAMKRAGVLSRLTERQELHHG